MRADRILFPTDFSAASAQALGAALFTAELLDAELVLQHVLVFREADLHIPEAHFPQPEELFEKLHELATSELGKLVEERHERPLRLREVVDRSVDAARRILERADEDDVDLIVLGTHGRRGAAHLLLGSVAAEVLRQARCPVLTMRSGSGSRPLRKLGHLVAAHDFSSASDRALTHAAALARAVDARLDLVHVLEAPEVPMAPTPLVGGWATAFFEDLEPKLSAKLAEVRARDLAGIPGENLVLRGRGALALVEHLEPLDVDLVVQGSQGRTGLDRILLGSFAERLARLAPCAVLTVPARGRGLL
ncbi:MAG: universal stress protein [Acidobacteria bacterium]|nr:universal stress protein [Acidobacteriota bacterium]